MSNNSTTDNNLWQLLKTSAGGGGGGGVGDASAANQLIANSELVTIASKLPTTSNNLLGVSGGGYSSTVVITRAATTTPYLANSVYGGVFKLLTTANVSAFMILSSIKIIFNISSLPIGMGGFRLYLYSAAPPSNVIDGGAFSVPATDRSALLTPGGGIVIGNAVAEIGGGTVGLNIDNLNIQIPLSSGGLWGYLVTVGGFAPAAPSETTNVTLYGLGV